MIETARSRRRTLAWAGAAVSVALYGASFPPLHWRPLAWIALVPLLVAIRRVPAREAGLLSIAWAFSMAYVTGTWLPPAIATYFEQPLFVGFAFFLFVAGSMVGPYYWIFSACQRRMAARLGTALPLLSAAAWVLAELLRGRLFTGTPVFIGNPWALLGYSQVGFDAILQIASITGIYGVSFVIVAVNAALAEAWIDRSDGAPFARRRLLVGFVPALLALGFGQVALRKAEAEGGPRLRVAVVQGNLDLGSRWKPELYGRNLDVYLGLTRAALAQSQPDLVFWPEAAMTFFVDQEPAYRRAVGRALGDGPVELVAGAPRVEGDGREARYYNTTYLFDSAGEILAYADKEYLVPFTEYFPFRIDFLRRQFGRAREFTRGEPRPPLPTRAGAAGVAVCNEAMLPEVVSARVSDGAEYVVNPSNDSWLADEQYSEMQFDVVTVRAIEQRRYLVRASTSGPSAVVDPWGRVRVRSEPLTRSVIVGTIAPRRERTLYNRLGDTFAFGCAAAVGLALVTGRRASREGSA